MREGIISIICNRINMGRKLKRLPLTVSLNNFRRVNREILERVN